MDAETTKILQVISQMTKSEGWQHLKKDFLFHVKQLQDQINEPGGNEMKYSEGDLLKIRMKILSDVIDYPERFLTMVQKGNEPEEQDPFE